jgi:hypothetical protein
VAQLTHPRGRFTILGMTAIPAPTRIGAFPARDWIQSPAWDLFWMFSALWAGVLLLAASVAAPLFALVTALFVFDRLLSVLHSWSTSYMVLFSPLLRRERRENPRRYVVLPVLIAAGSLALGLYVAHAQRYPADGRPALALWPFFLYIGLFWVGHFWHFGRQDFGVLTLYRARAGQGRPIDRRADQLYAAAMMYGIQPVVYLSLVTTTAFSEVVHAVVPISRAAFAAAASAAVGAAALLSLALAAFELSKPNRSLPRLLYMLVMFLHPTLLLASVRAGAPLLGFAYLVAYLWSHWLIAVGLVSRINARFNQTRGDSPGAALLRHFAVLGAIAGLVFLATERHKEYLLFNTDGFAYKQLLSAIAPEQALAIGLVLGFFLGEQLLHYYCDRCLFRFRDPAVRRRVAPLLLGEGPPR